MDYKVNEEFLDKVDALLDATTELFQHSDTLDGAGVVLVNLGKFEKMRNRFIVLCEAMEEYFPEFGKEEEENEEDTEECTLVGDHDDGSSVGI